MFVVHRSPENPLLAPRREHPWEALAAFNPSVIPTKDGVLMYYRALANPEAIVAPYAAQSTIGLAFSEDRTHFHSQRQVIIPSEPWDAFGCEDPRATFFEGAWYVFYTALGGVPFGPDNIKVGLAIGTSPDQFQEKHLITPFNAKAATLFPERVNGDIVMLLTAHTDYTDAHPRPTIAFARAKRMEEFFDPAYWQDWHDHLEEHALPDIRRADDDHIEVGAAPVLTEKGWLIVYSYIEHFYDERRRVFTVEAAMLDRNNPQNILSRTYPFMVPEEIYEQYGHVPDIVFPTSVVMAGEYLELYYGAADTTCAKASIRTADLVRDLDPSGPARTFLRAAQNPILTARPEHAFESAATFNPAAIDLDGSIHILYRAMGADNTSTIGYARSADGITIDERLPTPIYGPRADFEMKRGSPTGNSGCEDPRAVVIDDRVYLSYTAYDGVRPPHGAISSISVSDFLAHRFDQWTMPVLVTPSEVDDKDVALLPEKVDGNYQLYHRISSRICADIMPDLLFTKPVQRCIEIMGPRRGMWDSAKVGVAAPPLRVEAGWLMIYHGVSDTSHYRIGAALLDAAGTSLLARTADPIFEPIAPYEKNGVIGNVVFPCGTVVRDDTLFLYYGGADTVTGVATASISHILSALS